MLYTLALILVTAWFIGYRVFPATGGLMHLLLVLGALLILLTFRQGRRAPA